MRVGEREGFTPERAPLAADHGAEQPWRLGAHPLRPVPQPRLRRWRPFHQSTPGAGGVVS